VARRAGEPFTDSVVVKRTIVAVSAQPASAVTEVEIRCDRCARDLGDRAPLLGVVGRDYGSPDRWRFSQLPRLSRRQAGQLGTPEAPSPRVAPLPVAGFPRPNDLPRRRSTKLMCRRCHAKPRMTVRDLIQQAARAAAEGRRVIYV
jgi:hypothetical protein